MQALWHRPRPKPRGRGWPHSEQARGGPALVLLPFREGTGPGLLTPPDQGSASHHLTQAVLLSGIHGLGRYVGPQVAGKGQRQSPPSFRLLVRPLVSSKRSLRVVPFPLVNRNAGPALSKHAWFRSSCRCSCLSLFKPFVYLHASHFLSIQAGTAGSLSIEKLTTISRQVVLRNTMFVLETSASY